MSLILRFANTHLGDWDCVLQVSEMSFTLSKLVYIKSIAEGNFQINEKAFVFIYPYTCAHAYVFFLFFSFIQMLHNFDNSTQSVPRRVPQRTSWDGKNRNS